MARSLRNTRVVKRVTAMSTAKKVRYSALAATVVAAITLGVVATGSTNADFSDTKSGTITGTIGSIELQTAGGTGVDHMDFTWSNMLPGKWYTVKVTYTNVGRNAEDVTAKFDNNPTALSALNDLGHYGAVKVYGGTDGKNLKFSSTNLSDHAGSCGAFSETGCWPLQGEVPLLKGLQPGGSGTFVFEFQYQHKLQQQASHGVVPPFNAYPAADGQTTIRQQDGTGSGLPIQLAGTQQ